jgi:hypothetical protein
MKMNVSAYAVASLVLGVSSAQAQYANVTITGEVRPGVYGRVEIGNRPPPPLVSPQPVIIVREPRPAPVQPIYLHVPPGHAKKWSKHCHKYNACNRPVYFVKSREYDPGYRPDKGKGKDWDWDDKGKGKGWAKGHKDRD